MSGAPEIHLPLDGRVTQGFGCSPYYTGIPGPGCPAEAFWFHDGIDIAAPIGTPARAGMTGTVVFAGADGDGPLCNRGYRGYGLAVLVDGGNGRPPGEGWQALYAHLSRIDVAVGDVVRPDTVLGASGDTGCVSGAHLHFGLRRDGALVDPLAFAR
jgi:murein DD-endopeptidase MepM/ murein hydrolase activator NlpD